MKKNKYLKYIHDKLRLGKLRAINHQYQSIMSWYFSNFNKNMVAMRRSLSKGYVIYDLQQRNKEYLGSMISVMVKKDYDEIMSYIHEIENDENLAQHFLNVMESDPYLRRCYGNKMYFGRRSGWYAVIRAIRPKVVVETGVSTGIGSCMITAALMKNHQEGHPGYYYGTEIDPTQGVFLKEPYAQYGEICLGDSVETLKSFDKKIDLLITDSTHNPEYETHEYEATEHKLSDQVIILANNSQNRNTLQQFANATNRNFLFFREEPLNHWRSGGGIGFAFRK